MNMGDTSTTSAVEPLNKSLFLSFLDHMPLFHLLRNKKLPGMELWHLLCTGPMIFWIDFLYLGSSTHFHSKLPWIEHKCPALLVVRTQAWGVGSANQAHEGDTVLEVCKEGRGLRGTSLVPREKGGQRHAVLVVDKATPVEFSSSSG